MLVGMTGEFDNGHDFYTVDAEVNIDEKNGNDLTAEMIVDIVHALERQDRKNHGRSYRGRCIGFSVSDEDWDSQIENGNVCINEFDECDEYSLPKEGYEWLNIICTKSDIEKAFKATND